MKIWTIIEELTENPNYDRLFETKDFNGDVMKAYMLREYEGGKDVIVTEGWDGEIREYFLNDFMRNREWEEVKKPVGFIELLSTVESNGDFANVDFHYEDEDFEECNLYYILSRLAERSEDDRELAHYILNGKWYIE